MWLQMKDFSTGKEVILLLDELALSSDSNSGEQLLNILSIAIFFSGVRLRPLVWDLGKGTDKFSLWGKPDCSGSQVPIFGA